MQEPTAKQGEVGGGLKDQNIVVPSSKFIDFFKKFKKMTPLAEKNSR